MSIEDQRIAHGRKTRTALIQAARRLFVQGYDKVGTPEIVRAAKVTRGALYHHFKDKRALFEAVVDDVARDLVGSINSAAETEADQPLEAILAGCRAFLASAQDKEVRQIFLVDAPAVLGWGTWRAIDARHGLGSLKEGLQACAEQRSATRRRYSCCRAFDFGCAQRSGVCARRTRARKMRWLRRSTSRWSAWSAHCFPTRPSQCRPRPRCLGDGLSVEGSECCLHLLREAGANKLVGLR